MSEELGLGQREISLNEVFDLSEEEDSLVLTTVKSLLTDILKASGSQTLNTLLGEFAQNASMGLQMSAESKSLGEAGLKSDVT